RGIGAVGIEHHTVIDGIGGARRLAGIVAVVDGAEDRRELIAAARAPAVAALRAGGEGAVLRCIEEIGILRPIPWREIGHGRRIADRRVPLRRAAGDERCQDDCDAPISRQAPPPPGLEKTPGVAQAIAEVSRACSTRQRCRSRAVPRLGNSGHCEARDSATKQSPSGVTPILAGDCRGALRAPRNDAIWIEGPYWFVVSALVCTRSKIGRKNSGSCAPDTA